MTTTTEQAYEADLAEAFALAVQFVDPSQCDGCGKNWIGDALNNEWREGMTITAWVARAVARIPAGFRRSAA